MHAPLQLRAGLEHVGVEHGRRARDVAAHAGHHEEGCADPGGIVLDDGRRRCRHTGRGHRVLDHRLGPQVVVGERRLQRRQPDDHPGTVPARGRRAPSRSPCRPRRAPATRCRRSPRPAGHEPGMRRRPSGPGPPAVRRRRADPPWPPREGNRTQRRCGATADLRCRVLTMTDHLPHDGGARLVVRRCQSRRSGRRNRRLWATVLGTLRLTKRFMPLMPLLPTTTRSAPRFAAVSKSASAGSPPGLWTLRETPSASDLGEQLGRDLLDLFTHAVHLVLPRSRVGEPDCDGRVDRIDRVHLGPGHLGQRHGFLYGDTRPIRTICTYDNDLVHG